MSILFVAITALSFGLANAEPVSVMHERIITMDAEMDIPTTFMEGNFDVSGETTMQVDLPKMDRGGLDGAIFVANIWQQPRTPESDAKARAEIETKISAIEKMTRVHAGRIGLARSADEAESLVAQGKHFAVMGLTGAGPLGDDLQWFHELHDRGLRKVSFNHAGHNQFADSSRPLRSNNDPIAVHGGLSDLGRDLLRSMNDLGVIVDVSQSTSAVLFEVVGLSRAPVIASHSGVKALRSHPRNLTNSEMEAIKSTGGGVGLVAFGGYLREPLVGESEAQSVLSQEYGSYALVSVRKESPDRIEEFKVDRAKFDAEFPPVSLGMYVNSIDYAVNLLGIDHVFIASDMEHGGGVSGWMDASETPNVTKELRARGYTEEEIAKLWWGNFARIWREVEKVANN